MIKSLKEWGPLSLFKKSTRKTISYFSEFSYHSPLQLPLCDIYSSFINVSPESRGVFTAEKTTFSSEFSIWVRATVYLCISVPEMFVLLLYKYCCNLEKISVYLKAVAVGSQHSLTMCDKSLDSFLHRSVTFCHLLQDRELEKSFYWEVRIIIYLAVQWCHYRESPCSMLKTIGNERGYHGMGAAPASRFTTRKRRDVWSQGRVLQLLV